MSHKVTLTIEQRAELFDPYQNHVLTVEWTDQGLIVYDPVNHRYLTRRHEGR